ncbi:MAG: hypothetical protein H0V63_00960 [Burkholderiaceae bacterium]|nr:hypothetical protein [Burkholderiaceae bacterium]
MTKQRHIYRTGRATRVREHLATQATPQTARQILEAVEPDGDITLMCATLATMTRSGYLIHDTAALGRHIRYTLSKSRPRRDNTRTDPPAKAPSRRVAAAAPKGTSPTPKKATPAAPVNGRTNFVAALGTVSFMRAEKSEASRRIAADIATFQRKGGRIEKLPVGASVTPLQHKHKAASAATTRKRNE